MAERIVAGKYKLIATIGRGGMAVVYRAEEIDTKRLVALKLLQLDEGATTADREDMPEDLRELIERFEREARAASAIETEHIVQVFDTGVDPVTGAPYIAMELLEGRDLNQLLHQLVALPPEVAVRLMGQALTGLAQAHKAGIVHRDLKPANLFVDDSAFGQVRVKLVDFGIAKVQKAPIATLDTHGLTQTGSVLGTPRYMSPEQIERPRGVDARSDVWSMGVVMYKCLTGRCPHDDAETLGAMLMALMTKPSPPIQSIAPWVSADLARFVHRALERNPADRFASASEMLEALRPLSPGGFGLRDRDLVSVDEERKAKLKALSTALPSLTNEVEAVATVVQGATGAAAVFDARAAAAAAPAVALAPTPAPAPAPAKVKAAPFLGGFRTALSRTFRRKAKAKPRPRAGRKPAERLREALPALTSVLAFLVMAAGVFLVIRAAALPAPRSESAPPDTFSAARAVTQLTAIAGAGVPRPSGSAEAARVHDLLIARLKTLGYAPLEQNTLVCRAGIGCSYVRNVLARTRDPGEQGMTLLVSHYDSVAAGPGAGDDGSGTAIALEIARALSAAPPPPTARAVGFLFDDGEESGLYGAQAFVDQHPWMRDVRSVVNLEARGTSGESFLFEVIGDSDAVSEVAASALARPSTSSLMATIYAHMPNSTDLTVFRRHGGVTGANLAFLGGVTRYHTARDTVDEVDRGSLQAQGDNALALVRAFADPAFAPAGAGDSASSWFDVLHQRTWRAGLVATWGLAGLTVLVSLVALGRVKASLSAIVRALFGLLLGPLLAGGLSTVLLFGAHEAGLPPAMFLADPRFLLTAFAGVAVGSLALAGGLSRYARDANTEVASQVGWILLAAVGGAAAYWAPGTAYLFVLPALVAGLVRVLAPRTAHVPEAAAAFVLALLATEVILLLPEALGFDLAAALVVPPVLLLLPYAPLVSGIARPVALAGLLAMIGGVVMALRDAGLHRQRARAGERRLHARSRARRGDHRGGCGVGEVGRGDRCPRRCGRRSDRTRHRRRSCRGSGTPRCGSIRTRCPRRSREARRPRLPEGMTGAVHVETVQAATSGHLADDMAPSTRTGRTVHLHLTPPPDARAIGIAFPEPTAVHSATLEGAEWPAGERGSEDTQFRFFLLQAPSETARTKGVDVVLSIDGAEVVEGRVFALSSGVPPVAQAVVDARPRTASPTQDGDSTWIWTTQKF